MRTSQRFIIISFRCSAISHRSSEPFLLTITWANSSKICYSIFRDGITRNNCDTIYVVIATTNKKSTNLGRFSTCLSFTLAATYFSAWPLYRTHCRKSESSPRGKSSGYSILLFIFEWFCREFSLLGLFIIAVGTGGIKPCVSAFGGEQFVRPEQDRQLEQFFSYFYISINAGSLLSTLLTPILREDVQCFGQSSCFPLAFGVPAVLMLIAIGISKPIDQPKFNSSN